MASPKITGFSPGSGSTGSKVVITGNGFAGITAVNFNGTSSAYTVDSTTQITATVPAGATSGNIRVISPAGSPYSPTTFAVLKAPALESFSPASGAAGSKVVLKGANFTGATQVLFNGTAAVFTVNSASQITATVPAAAASGGIRVVTPGGAANSATSFQVTGSAVVKATITSFAPASGAAGTSVVITGTGFTGVTAVIFNGAAATYRVDSSTQITANVPTGATSGNIRVIASGGSPYSPTVFTVTKPVAVPAPSVTSFAPSWGHPGEQVTLTGTGFTGTTQVLFGSVAATFTVSSPTTIVATVPALAVSSAIKVVNPGGSSISTAQFSVARIPSITTFSPRSRASATPSPSPVAGSSAPDTSPSAMGRLRRSRSSRTPPSQRLSPQPT